MGLVWANGTRDEISAAGRDLQAMQTPRGGWPQLPRRQPDAYSTGEALFALHEAGMPLTDAAWSKGVKFLISTQAADGTWHVQTRMISPADVSPKYFPAGFPYGKDEFISYAGSCWAVMALLSGLPESSGNTHSAKLPDHGESDAPAWLAPVLFGDLQQLQGLLDAGLDPNGRTANGTTVLMAAAPDAGKIRLLLARGADAKARGGSGHDALTIAAAYRGSAAAIQALIDAGAAVEPPEGVRVRNTPLVFASMTGDIENVKLLLARGARPSEGALSNAATFGYPDVVRTLLKAGADAGIIAGSGINLLHWAAITNRAAIVPALVEARVPVNAVDDFGYTPLMYAATIDFGDAEVAKALLNAGADKKLRNSEGRTPLAQARRYKHTHIEALLR